MSLNLKMPETTELKPKITVFGVGGAGGNAVANMISAQLEGVEFVVANTDAQALTMSPCDRRVQLGEHITQGLGAGARPEIGCAAAEEALDEIREHLHGSHMVFITAGMGGGTGTGGAPVIARAARDENILTVGVVTKPFQFEGARRMRIADEGIEELQQYVDTLIVIPNQNLFRIANEKTTFADAFAMADQVLHSGVRGITDLMVMPGLINLDFNDVRTVMDEMGKAMMGTGEASGEKRAIEAAEAAISNPLLDEVSMKGARGVLINITGGMDLTLFEVDEAANRIRSEVDPDANIIVGSTFDQNLDGVMRVSVVATGIDSEEEMAAQPERRIATIGQPRMASPQEVRAPQAQVAAPAAAPAAAPVATPTVAEAPVAEPAKAESPARVQLRQIEEGLGAADEAAAEDDGAESAGEARMEAGAGLPGEAVSRPAPAGVPGSAPAGPAAGAGGGFVPPRPVTVERRAPEAHDFRSPAAKARAGGAPGRGAEPGKRQSFFERMTNAARGPIASMTGSRQAEPDVQEPMAPEMDEARAAPQASAPQRPAAAQPAAPQSSQPAPQQAPQQAPQAGVPAQAEAPSLKAEPNDRLDPKSGLEEEQLEIPAFLRRQAN